MSDNESTRVKSPEELELEKQAAIAKLRNSILQDQANTEKAVADAKKARWDDQKGLLKGPEVGALSGGITSDGTFIESRILARKTLGAAFVALSAALKGSAFFRDKKDVRLILYNAADIPMIEAYAGLRIQLSTLLQHYTRANADADGLVKVPVAAATSGGRASQPGWSLRGSSGALPEAAELRGVAALAGVAPVVAALASGPMMAGYAGAAVLRTAIDVVSLFRVNTDYKNFDLPIDDTALAAEFKQALPGDWKLWQPACFPVNTVDGGGVGSSNLLDLLDKVQDKNKEAEMLTAKVNSRTRELGAALAVEKDMDRQQELQGRLDAFAGSLNILMVLTTAYTQLQGMLLATDTTTKASPLTMILQAERLTAMMKTAYVVRLAAISKGSNKISQRLWSSAVIRHSAGTELNCLVFAPDGEIVFADTQLNYTPYMRAEEITV